jgi:penicillin G amidase
MGIVNAVKRLTSGLLNIVIWGLALFLAVLVGYRVLTLPKTGGELPIKGIAADTSITRDEYGIPHIRAANIPDAYFALGFVHGQDRQWQLEMHRRIGRGALAQVLGAPALPTDKFLRTLGVHRNAGLIYAALDEPTKVLVSAYAKGINAAIALTRENPVLLSPEFFILGTRPVLWEPEDVIAWQTMMAWDLSANMQSEILRFELAAQLPTEKLAQLLDTDPPQKLPDLASLYGALIQAPVKAALGVPTEVSPVVGFLNAIPLGGVEGIGSNSWVLNGSRTKSGKPLLANDPHLALAAPALWYLAHLSAPGLEVIGGSVPGLPYIVAGRTDKTAWSLTTSSIDVQDLYLERFTAGQGNTVDTSSGPQALELREELIEVEGADAVKITVRTGSHGPLISDVHEPLAQMLRLGKLDKSYAMALKWAALTPQDTTVRAGFKINRAKDWLEFQEALRDFQYPAQNIGYADTQGLTALVVAGRTPKRRSDNPLLGLAPALGWEAKYEWEGQVPFEQMPQIDKTPNGAIVNANDKMIDKNYPHYLGAEWALPYRSQRISQLLAATPKHEVQGLQSIQLDVSSLAVKELLPVLLGTKPTTSTAADALALLAKWDGNMLANKPEPAIMSAWIDYLRKDVLADEVGPLTLQRVEQARTRYRVLANALTKPEFASWCDDVSTKALETCGQQQAKSLDSALAYLSQRYGSSMAQWEYGKVNMAISEHRPFGKHPALSKIFDIRTPVGGDTYSINVAKNDPWNAAEPMAPRWGASYRAVYDLADVNKSRYIQSTGQSGHRFSPHYSDLSGKWVVNDGILMLTDRAAIDKAAQAMLMLKPKQ